MPLDFLQALRPPATPSRRNPGFVATDRMPQLRSLRPPYRTPDPERAPAVRGELSAFSDAPGHGLAPTKSVDALRGRGHDASPSQKSPTMGTFTRSTDVLRQMGAGAAASAPRASTAGRSHQGAAELEYDGVYEQSADEAWMCGFDAQK